MVIATRGVSRVMDEILTVREVAEYLKLSRTTIWRWCNEGKLQAFKVGRGWRIHRSEVEKIVGQNLGAMEDNSGEE
ncbi:MAG: helix-turn-helix domain-containing protein [Anaerolineae bacterium]